MRGRLILTRFLRSLVWTPSRWAQKKELIRLHEIISIRRILSSERLHTISIFLAGGEGFYYSSQRENSQETKYINFRVTKWIENSKYLFWKKIRFQWQKKCLFLQEMLQKKKFLPKTKSCPDKVQINCIFSIKHNVTQDSCHWNSIISCISWWWQALVYETFLCSKSPFF